MVTRRHIRAACAAALTALAAAAAPAGAAETVDSGALRAVVDPDPWQLTFAQSPRGPDLIQHPGTGSGPTGTLGFRTATGWAHATRVVAARREGAAYVAQLATSDPLGARIEARLEPAGEGVVRLRATVVGAVAEVTATGIGFRAPAGERYLGFGERSNAVDQRGNVVENYVAEGPWQPEERPFMAAFIPPWGYHPRDDATYFPMPWLVSTSGYGVLVENTQTSNFRLATEAPDAWSLEVEARFLSLRVFAGPRPADVVRRLTAAIGRQPKPPAPWVLGPWFHTGQENVVDPDREAEYVRLLRDSDAPVSAAETHMRYLPCGVHRQNRDYERARSTRLHRAGLAKVTYFNPEICQDYEPVFSEAVARGVLQRRENGEPYVFEAYVGDRTPPQTPVGQVDFTAPGAQEFYDGLLREAVDDGADGWMEDFGEYTPPDSRSANGMRGDEMHNLYPVPYHCAGYDFTRRAPRPIVRHIRSGWTGVHRCAQVVWGGDPTTDWGFDGLASAVTNGLTMGLSGISTWGSDIGGFFSLGTRALTPELLIRWIQLGAVSGVMRTKPGGVAVPPKTRPQIWEDGQRGHWRRYAKLRTQLYPYVAGADAEYRRTGMPIMRHLALAYPGDPRSAARDDQFLFGQDLMAAPVLAPGATTRRTYLPPGRWVDLWRSVGYRQSTGGLKLRGARTLDGGREVTLPAPLEELPLLARIGAVLPLLPPDVDTLADYGSQRGLVKLRHRLGRMELLAFPRGRARARAGESETLRSLERTGRWHLTVKGSRVRTYSLQASMLTLRHPLRPCRVELGGRALPRRAWSYKRSTGVLRVRFRARRATLVVRGRC